MNDPTRVGVIGVSWGALVHVPAFRAAGGYEVVALCSRRPEPLEKAAKELGVPSTSTDWESFVERPDLDVISIAAPVSLHHRMTLSAVRAGKHVVCEKPVAVTAEEALEMTEAAESAGVATATGFEKRWTADRLAIADLVRAGQLGQLYGVRITHRGGIAHPSRAPQSTWMYELSAGGGWLNGLVSHELDFVRAVFGEPTELAADVRVAAPVRTTSDGETIDIDADDTSTLLIRLDSGAIAVISSTAVAAGPTQYLLEAFGSDGTIIASSSGEHRLSPADITYVPASSGEMQPVPLVPRDPTHPEQIPDRRAAYLIRAAALMFQEWRPSLDGAATSVPTLRDGWSVQNLIEKSRVATVRGGWVSTSLE